jgi:hypothetical protein
MMERADYEEVLAFTRSLNGKRLQMSDGQLLDQCQQHLDTLVAHLAAEFEEHPHINEVTAAPPPPPVPEPEPPPSPPARPAPEIVHHHAEIRHKPKAPVKRHR